MLPKSPLASAVKDEIETPNQKQTDEGRKPLASASNLVPSTKVFSLSDVKFSLTALQLNLDSIYQRSEKISKALQDACYGSNLAGGNMVVWTGTMLHFYHGDKHRKVFLLLRDKNTKQCVFSRQLDPSLSIDLYGCSDCEAVVLFPDKGVEISVVLGASTIKTTPTHGLMMERSLGTDSIVMAAGFHSPQYMPVMLQEQFSEKRFEGFIALQDMPDEKHINTSEMKFEDLCRKNQHLTFHSLHSKHSHQEIKSAEELIQKVSKQLRENHFLKQGGASVAVKVTALDNNQYSTVITIPYHSAAAEGVTGADYLLRVVSTADRITACLVPGKTAPVVRISSLAGFTLRNTETIKSIPKEHDDLTPEQKGHSKFTKPKEQKTIVSLADYNYEWLIQQKGKTYTLCVGLKDYQENSVQYSPEAQLIFVEKLWKLFQRYVQKDAKLFTTMMTKTVDLEDALDQAASKLRFQTDPANFNVLVPTLAEQKTNSNGHVAISVVSQNSIVQKPLSQSPSFWQGYKAPSIGLVTGAVVGTIYPAIIHRLTIAVIRCLETGWPVFGVAGAILIYRVYHNHQQRVFHLYTLAEIAEELHLRAQVVQLADQKLVVVSDNHTNGSLVSGANGREQKYAVVPSFHLPPQSPVHSVTTKEKPLPTWPEKLRQYLSYDSTILDAKQEQMLQDEMGALTKEVETLLTKILEPYFTWMHHNALAAEAKETKEINTLPEELRVLQEMFNKLKSDFFGSKAHVAYEQRLNAKPENERETIPTLEMVFDVREKEGYGRWFSEGFYVRPTDNPHALPESSISDLERQAEKAVTHTM